MIKKAFIGRTTEWPLAWIAFSLASLAALPLTCDHASTNPELVSRTEAGVSAGAAESLAVPGSSTVTRAGLILKSPPRCPEAITVSSAGLGTPGPCDRADPVGQALSGGALIDLGAMCNTHCGRGTSCVALDTKATIETTLVCDHQGGDHWFRATCRCAE